MGQDRSVAGQDAGYRRGPLHLALWCSLSIEGEEIGEEVDLRVQSGLPFLPEEVEARAVFPLGTVKANSGSRNPAPWMQWWVAHTRVIATLLSTYLKLRE